MDFLIGLLTGRRRRRSPIGLVISLIVAVVVLWSVGSAVIKNLQGLQVNNVFTTTKATYDAWDPKSGNAPSPQTDTFSHGTTGLAIYYELQGATANKTSVVLKIFEGTTQITVTDPKIATSDNFGMLRELDNGGALTPGAYHVEVDVDGKAKATHSFTVQ